MADDTQSYNVASIRKLLRAAFTSEELRRFCQDNPAFQPIIPKFGPKSSLDDMIDQVIDHCRTKLLWDELLAAVRAESPRQYDHFEPELRVTNTGAESAEPSGDEVSVRRRPTQADKLDVPERSARNIVVLLSFILLMLVLGAIFYYVLVHKPNQISTGATQTALSLAWITPSVSSTPTATPTPTPTSTDTPTPTEPPSPTSTDTPTPTKPPSPTSTHTPPPTESPWPTSTHTPAPTRKPTQPPPPTSPPTRVACEGDTTRDVTVQLFQAYDEKNYAKALACSFVLEERWSVEANTQQNKKQASDCRYTPNPDDQAAVDDFWRNYWALNDVATGLFMRGEMFRIQGRCQEAKAIYEQVIDAYPCAFAWDPKNDGFFWNVADGAQNGLDQLSELCP
jgi:hypothetical protein